VDSPDSRRTLDSVGSRGARAEAFFIAIVLADSAHEVAARPGLRTGRVCDPAVRIILARRTHFSQDFVVFFRLLLTTDTVLYT
jgi:hypothetical protein